MILANLYSQQQSARRIADDAGINVQLIDATGSAVDYWHVLLQAAQNQGRLAVLLAYAAHCQDENTPTRH